MNVGTKFHDQKGISIDKETNFATPKAVLASMVDKQQHKDACTFSSSFDACV